MKTIIDKIQTWILVIALIGFGIWMIINPTMMEENVNITGRRFWLKSIFKFIWGIPGGALLFVFGGLSAYGLIKGYVKTEEAIEHDIDHDDEESE